ncbi:hypothetical protein IW262DRAFT_1299971 [Armillaria fumosa]|nr:hypothetical protein IW262DRAFT_1299971 [Armillaria fumosa]
MSAPQTQYAPTQSSSVLGGQIVGRSERQAAPPAALKLRLDLNLEVEIAIQAKVNGDITLSLLSPQVHSRTSRLNLGEPISVSLFRPYSDGLILPNIRLFTGTGTESHSAVEIRATASELFSGPW